MNPTISVRNIGPVKEFEATLATPGVHVIRGKQGAGKSTILRTVKFAVDGDCDPKPTNHDDAPAGEACVAGKTLRVMKTVREEGDLGVDGVGELNISDIHTPRFIDPKTRDRHRISGLIRLAGVEARPEMFHSLFGGADRFDAVVPADAVKTTDLVEMAGAVKRAADRAANSEEKAERTAKARMGAAQQLAEGIDTSRLHDEQKLQDQLAAAIEMHSRLSQQRSSALEVIRRAMQSKRQIAEAGGSVDVSAAEAAHVAAIGRVQDARSQVEAAERALEIAKAEFRERSNEAEAAAQAMVAARRHRDSLAAWQADVDAAAKIECPTEQEVAEAQQAVSAAKAAQAVGLSVRQAIRALDEVRKHDGDAKAHATAAQRLRDAAAGTMEVLSGAVASIPACPLKVKYDDDGNPRLVITTDRSEREYFDELSDGERWSVILTLAAATNRLIVLPQSAWGELADSTRDMIDRLARERGCYVLTAQADDGDLRCEAWKTEQLLTSEAA